jgi:hypothetical protein
MSLKRMGEIPSTMLFAGRVLPMPISGDRYISASLAFYVSVFHG